jgi:hypothetical protein
MKFVERTLEKFNLRILTRSKAVSSSHSLTSMELKMVATLKGNLIQESETQRKMPSSLNGHDCKVAFMWTAFRCGVSADSKRSLI